MLRNRSFKKYIGGMVLCMLVGIFLCNLAAGVMFRQMGRAYYEAISRMFGVLYHMEAVTEDVGEDSLEIQWIQILNASDYEQEGEQVLANYGIFPEDLTLQRQRSQRVWFYICMNGILVLFCVGILLIFIRYQKRREQRMQDMIGYIQQIEHGIYTLDMEENKEDDLSGLKNELYKVMILLKEAAVQSQNQKKAMADAMSDISHQLKTPMTSLTILLDNLSEAENMDTATRRSFLSEMTRQVTHMNWLVATMLKLSRLDAGVVTMKTESVPPLELIQEVLEQLELMAEWKQLSFDLQVYPDAKSQTWTDLSADRYWLREALLNLVKNAMEHSPENGRIRIRMEQNDIYLAIAIHNDGDVIPEQEQRHIFERFYRSSHAKKDSVGIGLSLAKAVIEQQHGYITVSSSEAEGTEFLVKLLYFF